MQDTKVKFKVHTGTIIGSEHQRRQVNNQDGFSVGEAEIRNKYYWWGVVCDGCSMGRQSEVGAVLLSNYLCEEVPYLLSSGSTIPEIPDQLFIAGLGYLRSLAAHTAMSGFRKQLEFIEHHLLCTVIGFVINDEKCLLFNAGDGVFIVNNNIHRIKQDNKPLYMAYHLLDKSILDLSEPIPFKFETSIMLVSALERIAVCSDGIEDGIVDQLWGHDHPFGLQRRLRVLRLQKKAVFSDDCTVVALEKIHSEGEEYGN